MEAGDGGEDGLVVDGDFETGDMDGLRRDGVHVVCDDGLIIEREGLGGGFCIENGVVEGLYGKPRRTLFVSAEGPEAGEEDTDGVGVDNVA